MREELKKIFYLGVGAASTTVDKATEIIDDLVEKGKLSVAEGKELGEELKRNFKDKKNCINEETDSETAANYMTKEDVLDLIADYDRIKRTEIEELKDRIKALENIQ